MTNENTTRTKANAVFFAAVMVLSMVAAGFAAAPAAAFNDEYDADQTFDNDEALADSLVWQGQTVAVDGFSANEDVALREDQGEDGTRLEEQLNADDNGVVVFDTEDVDAGNYFLSTDEGAVFEVAIQSLSVDFDEDSIQSDETAELEFDSNRGTYTLNVSADGDLDDEELQQLFADSGFTVDSGDDDDDEIVLENVNDGTVDADFSNVSDIDTGEYEFTFESNDTDAEDTASINVTEAGEGDVQFNTNSYSVPQGDVVNITLEFDETDTGTLVVGDLEDDGYQANISVEDDSDDGEVSVLFNTYAAGDRGTIAELADDDDEMEIQGESGSLTDLLDAGDYTVSASPTVIDSNDASDALEDESDVASLVIDERSTDGMQLWRTTDDVRDDVLEVQDDDGDDAAVEAITAGAEDGVVTETDQVAIGDSSDVLVHQISVTGLEGALEANGDVSSGALYDVLESDASAGPDDHPVTLTFEEQNPGANQEGNNFDATDLNREEFNAAVDIVYDDANGDYYVFLDLDTLNGALDDTSGVDPIEDGETYTADLTVQDPLFTDADGGDEDDEIEDAHESANADFDVVDADGDFNGDPVQVTNAENQTISGTMNVAPGTEFTVRARSDEDSSTNFVKNSEDVVVQPDGTFSAQFDFSEQELNDTFTTTTQQSPLTEELEVDGEVVESVGGSAVFEVSELNPSEATVTAGDTIEASATIENTGEQQDTKTVEFTVDGEAVASEDVTIEGGESTTFEVSIDTTDLDAGDYEHAVVTPDDEATGSLTIEAASDDGGNASDGDDGGDGDDGMDGNGTDGNGTDGNGTDGGDSTDDSTPGFGALVALVALIAAALLATRRTE
jgi:PGF-CTERM protein/surface glycoprotein (TIGR04207 family)